MQSWCLSEYKHQPLVTLDPSCSSRGISLVVGFQYSRRKARRKCYVACPQWSASLAAGSCMAFMMHVRIVHQDDQSKSGPWCTLSNYFKYVCSEQMGVGPIRITLQ